MTSGSLDFCMATAIGAVIQTPTKAPNVFGYVRPEDFEGQYRAMAEAIQSLRVAKTEISPVAVIDEMTRRGTLGRIGGSAEIFRVTSLGYGDADYAVKVITRHHRLRRLEQIGVRVTSRAQLDDADPFPIAQGVIDEAQAIVDGIESEGDITTQTLGEFLDRDDPPYDWVIPGLLERGDRLVLTGSEGLGKSVLVRQLAVAAAAGVHPFTHQRIKPQRVLVVDCENGPVKLRRALRGLVHVAKRLGDDPSDRMFLEAIPNGLDLTKPEDEQWLVRTVGAVQPDLFLTGPIYRLHAGNPNDEEHARHVARVLDRCRSVANCALVTEAHAGHGYGQQTERPVRPVGSSLWLRWPEFGYGLRASGTFDPAIRNVDFVPWRGDREERDWPKKLAAGGHWPWRAVEDTPWSATA